MNHVCKLLGYLLQNLWREKSKHKDDEMKIQRNLQMLLKV